MTIDRHHVAIAGLAAIGAASLIGGAPAVAADDAALKGAVEELRKAILSADKAKLAGLVAEELSYGHSDGRVQSKAEFIDSVVNRKATVKSIDFPDLKLSVVSNTGVARHRYVSDSELDGKANHVDQGQSRRYRRARGMAASERPMEAARSPRVQAGITAYRIAPFRAAADSPEPFRPTRPYLVSHSDAQSRASQQRRSRKRRADVL